LLGSAGAFGDSQPVLSDVGATKLARADFNDDGRADLVVLDDTTGTLQILLGNGDGSFQASLPQEVSGVPGAGLLVLDVNDDHVPDIVITLPGERGIAIGANPAPIPLRGDADRDGGVTAADLRQLVAEIFDGDGGDPASAAGGTVDSGAEADANADAAITAADLIGAVQRLGP